MTTRSNSKKTTTKTQKKGNSKRKLPPTVDTEAMELEEKKKIAANILFLIMKAGGKMQTKDVMKHAYISEEMHGSVRRKIEQLRDKLINN